ncbi:hypothetical protein AMK26_31095 [Streptomyces sp. CB03234]|uniref:hypothetical protein n=1 Tax=Streptomyces sp. (strain CB03234) TaxID=1703937 RepID=UPI00093928A4|nr:hypothetical protein [Streptomyces sp. CB03234]OKJ95056.1 hypothetical protein AMK26_31095 [Streptomyces sp. CB03234]
MDDKRFDGAGEAGPGVPRDLPDEQAGSGPDHWDPDLTEEPDAGAAERTPAEDTPEDGAPEEPTA